MPEMSPKHTKPALSEDYRIARVITIAVVVVVGVVASGITYCSVETTKARAACVDSGKPPLECKEAFLR